ncbi:ABC transporter substrate-binding protein [Bifidobacterium pseudolongum subsp. globosum]|uniref:ABC transporter substrate-binding protein n=1 Tax=Bifidobacterium pseudolongum TaxID=1694 RepID=UPI001F535F2A|nr:ABC transporter substrate-binding protein [Bifidobacterium pseudolongum]MCI1195461.1 ABC transporter substrate-binding protein [Bifidobacterium pseudolongum subsp. globosum]UNP92996.1 ABC transporter substrate-binding protein [Bifidobacterium pseudolongum subsp. globosum]UNZ09603.1 ABC transporter substrate-binding protein [Bifidobacterium pseudolongum subsp. globosum]
MNRTMKTAVGMLAVAAMAVPLAACGGGSDSSGDNGKGSVYFLNFKPEAADQWTALAKEYTDETGVQVKVQTAASGTYEQQLKSELAKSEAPTIFQVNGPMGYQNWKGYTADLTDSDIYKEMNDQSLALKGDDGQIVGVPYVIESYGIIYNKDLVNKYIALDGAVIKSADEIKDFDTLKKVADDMQKRKKDLGIEGAFTSAGFDSSSDWRFKTHLANIPLYYQFKKDNITAPPASIKDMYMDNFKNIFDLYITDSTTPKTQLSSKTGDDASSEFALGKAAFYQNGTWAWSDLQKAGMKADSLGMLPIYIGVDDKTEGLATGSENYWCINSKVSDANQKASLEFLKWVISSDKGKKALSEDMGFTTPFKTFNDVKTDNPLIQDANKSIQNTELTQVAWDFSMMPSEEYKNVLGQAMLNYAQGTGDWNAVVDAFVNNWKTEYDAAH